MTPYLPVLAINLAAIIAVMLLLWRYAAAIGDVSFIDVVWAWGMTGLAVLTALLAPPAGPYGWVLLALVTVWGLRLGTHLFRRWRRLGPDPRYQRIMASLLEKRGWGFSKAALIQVFGLQGPLLWFVSLPAQAGILADAGAPLTPLGWAGVVIALIGIGFESVGDAQLEAFRRDPANKGHVLDTGLWRLTRHPNYFGDACTWWGIWLVAVAAGAGVWTIAAPLFLTWTLNRWSGVPMLEKGLVRSRPGYAAYAAKTSAFIPWPPAQ